MKIDFVNSLNNVTYAIRDLVPLARKLEKEKEIIYLNIGDPLKYDFKTPSHIVEAAYKASMENNKNFYADSQGLQELREAIAVHEKEYNKVETDAENILVTQGVSEGIAFLAKILLNPGENILVPSPAYPLYLSIPLIYYAEPREYKMMEEDEWKPDVDDVRSKIDEKTKGIVIINPNNPTGAVYNQKDVKEIIDIAGEYSIPIISDEIYNKNIFVKNVEFKSPARLSKDVPVFVLNGFSKAYLMTGWRIGYLYLYDSTGENEERTMELLLKIARLRLSANTPAQYAALAALTGPQDHIEEVNRKFEKRANAIYKRLYEMGMFYVVKPKAAFYIFPKIEDEEFSDDKEFAKRLLLEAGVFIVQGSGFGSLGKRHFRAVTLPPEDLINRAMDKMEKFIKKNRV